MIKYPRRCRTISANEGGLVLYDQARNDVFHKQQPIITTTTTTTAAAATTISQQDPEELKRVHSLFAQQDERTVAIRHPSITTLMLLQCQVSLIQAISTIPSKPKPTTNFIKLTVSSGQQVLRWSMLCGLFVLDNVSRALGVENEMVSLDDESTVFVDGQVNDDRSPISYRPADYSSSSSSSSGDGGGGANSSNNNHNEIKSESFPSLASPSSSQAPIPDLSLSQTPVSGPSSVCSTTASPVVITDVSQTQDPITAEPTQQSQAPAPTTVTQPEPHQSSSTPLPSQQFSLPPRRSSPTPAHINYNTPVGTNNVISSRLPVARTRKISLPMDSAVASRSHVRSLSNNMTMPSQHASIPSQLAHHHHQQQQQQPSLRRSTGRRDLASTLGGNHSGVSLNNITMRPKSTSSTDDITQVHYHHHHHYHQDQVPSPSSTTRSASSMARKVLPWKS